MDTLLTKSQTNAEESNGSNKVYSNESIDGTPFKLVNDGSGWFIAWGRYAVIEKQESMEKALGILEVDFYTIIERMLMIFEESKEWAKKQSEKTLPDNN